MRADSVTRAPQSPRGDGMLSSTDEHRPTRHCMKIPFHPGNKPAILSVLSSNRDTGDQRAKANCPGHTTGKQLKLAL